MRICLCVGGGCCCCDVVTVSAATDDDVVGWVVVIVDAATSAGAIDLRRWKLEGSCWRWRRRWIAAIGIFAVSTLWWMMVMMKCIFTCCIDCTTIVSYLSSNITAAATAAIICGRHNGEIARSNCDLREPEREDEGIDSSFHGQNRHHCAFAREVPFSVFLPKRFHTLLHRENELFMHHINTGHHFFWLLSSGTLLFFSPLRRVGWKWTRIDA